MANSRAAAEAELERRIAQAVMLKEREERIRELDGAFELAERENYPVQALLALQLLQPQLFLAGYHDRAALVDREIERLKVDPRVAKVRATPIPATAQALIDRTTSPTCVYLAVDIDKAAKIRARGMRIARLQLLKRKARSLNCEATTIKALELLRAEFRKPKDGRRLAHIEAELQEMNEHMKALRAKADAESAA